MSKLHNLYEKSVDYLLARSFVFWVWLGHALGVEIVAELSDESREAITKLLVDLVTENDELKARCRELKDSVVEATGSVVRLQNENHQLEDTIEGQNKTIREMRSAESGDTAATGPSRVNAKKLTQREVSLIRDLHRAGSSQRDIAYSFDVNPATISRIVRGIYHR